MQNLALKKMKQPEPSFSSASSITIFPAVGPNDAPAPPLTLKIAFGESSKSSNAQQICISYSKGLSDEQVPSHPPAVSSCSVRSRAFQVSLIRKSETKRRKAAAKRREDERALRAEQA